MRIERESASKFCLYSLSQLFNTWIITKRSKSYLPYLYTQIKYKSITVHIKYRTRGDD